MSQFLKSDRTQPPILEEDLDATTLIGGLVDQVQLTKQQDICVRNVSKNQVNQNPLDQLSLWF